MPWRINLKMMYISGKFTVEGVQCRNGILLSKVFVSYIQMMGYRFDVVTDATCLLFRAY